MVANPWQLVNKPKTIWYLVLPKNAENSFEPKWVIQVFWKAKTHKNNFFISGKSSASTSSAATDKIGTMLDGPACLSFKHLEKKLNFPNLHSSSYFSTFTSSSLLLFLQVRRLSTWYCQLSEHYLTQGYSDLPPPSGPEIILGCWQTQRLSTWL